eukprot:c10242_g1_i1.p1 GENE.c10242_g1_i1~~c10242_g1_i1.p1  ORF type:complete len:836 (-),score=200.06 c10242_g1_i1:165-2672(-)
MKFSTNLTLFVLLVSQSCLCFDQKSLIPNIEELEGTLTQLVSAASKTASSQYEQVVQSEKLLVAVRSMVQQDQSRDQEWVSRTQAALTADVASSEVALERHREIRVHHMQVRDRLQSSLKAIATDIDETYSQLTDLQKEHDTTKSQCQAIADLHAQRAAAFAQDAQNLTQILDLVRVAECHQLPGLLKHVSTLVTVKMGSLDSELLRRAQVTCDCQTLAPTISLIQATPTCNCSADSHSPLSNTVAMSCSARKEAIATLVGTLRDETYAAASQDTHSFDVSQADCSLDLHVVDGTIITVNTKLSQLKRDEVDIQAQLPHVDAEISILDSTISAFDASLEASRSKLKKLLCRFKRRSLMRIEQHDLVATLLDTLQSLRDSSYLISHHTLTLSCSPECSSHGFCFNGACECEASWQGKDCSISLHPRECPFDSTSAPCVSEACATVDYASLTLDSDCAGVVCDHCRQSTSIPRGCDSAPTAMFCAEREVRNGCDHVTCATPLPDACGQHRSARSSFIGCCFNKLLDCEDRCARVTCAETQQTCGAGLAVRYPFRDCCFNPAEDCIDACAVQQCPNTEPVCPAGQQVHHPFVGCCFDAALDCEADCTSVVCSEDSLPGDVCRNKGLRWQGRTAGCCFDATVDCAAGDDDGQAAERMALEALFSGTHGQTWLRKDGMWGTQRWICYWEGVTCSGSPGNMHVTALVLAANGLTGTIPEEIRHLQYLRELDLSTNFLEGPIPAALGELQDLRSVKLSKNQLANSIPATLAQLAKLEILDVSFNFLTGDAPMELTNDEREPVLMLTCSDNCMCSSTGPCGGLRSPAASPFNPHAVACPPCPQ